MLKPFPVAILAGGRATRLHPLTLSRPKSLIEVAGRPFILHQLELLRQQGVTHAILCLGHLGEQIEACLGAQPVTGLSLEYSHDGALALGTGGALRKALPLLGEHFVVLNGDSYLPCPLMRILGAYAAAGRPALMTVLHNADRFAPSNVRFERGVLLDYDKRRRHPAMRHIDFGLSVFARGVFTGYAPGEPFDLAELCHELAARGELAAYEVKERFYEIGSHQGLRETEAFLRERAAS